MLLVRSVEHPTSPGCLQPLMFTFVEVEECLLRWQNRTEQGLLPVSGLNILKTDGRDRCIPCHADVVEVD